MFHWQFVIVSWLWWCDGYHHNISTLHPTMSGGMSVPLLGDEEDNDFNTGNRFQPCYVYKVSDVSFWLCACTFESPITFKVLKKKGGSYENNCDQHILGTPRGERLDHCGVTVTMEDEQCQLLSLSSRRRHKEKSTDKQTERTVLTIPGPGGPQVGRKGSPFFNTM